MMEFLQSQNLTLYFYKPVYSPRESRPLSSPGVTNTIIVLFALTFALQLCLVLFCLLRSWSLDKKVREALKHPESLQELWTVSSSFPRDAHKQTHYQLYDDAAASSPAAVEEYEPTTIPLFGPSMPADLVQS